MSGEFLFVLRNHMMRFTAFPEIQLNPDMRDKEIVGGRSHLSHRHYTHPQGIYLDISPIPPVPPNLGWSVPVPKNGERDLNFHFIQEGT